MKAALFLFYVEDFRNLQQFLQFLNIRQITSQFFRRVGGRLIGGHAHGLGVVTDDKLDKFPVGIFAKHNADGRIFRRQVMLTRPKSKRSASKQASMVEFPM